MEEGSLRCDANVSVRRPGDASGHALRDQEPELDALRRPRGRVRGEAPDRGPRGGRRDRAGDPAVRCDQGRDPPDAHQGGGARLPLLPGPGPVAAGAGRRLHRADRGGAARAAGRQEGALRRAVRAFGLRRRGAGRRAGLRRLFRAGGERARRQAGGELGDRRPVRRAQPGGPGHRAGAGHGRSGLASWSA